MENAAALAAISAVRTTEEKKAILLAILDGVMSDPLTDSMRSEFILGRIAATIRTMEKINEAKDGAGIVVAQIEAMIAFEEIGDIETKDLIANALATVGR